MIFPASPWASRSLTLPLFCQLHHLFNNSTKLTWCNLLPYCYLYRHSQFTINPRTNMPYSHVADSSLSLCTCPVWRHPLNHLRHRMELSPSVTCSVHNNQTECRLDFLTSDRTYINRTEVFGLTRVNNYSQVRLFGYWVNWRCLSKKWRLKITHCEALCNNISCVCHFSVASGVWSHLWTGTCWRDA